MIQEVVLKKIWDGMWEWPIIFHLLRNKKNAIAHPQSYSIQVSQHEWIHFSLSVIHATHPKWGGMRKKGGRTYYVIDSQCHTLTWGLPPHVRVWLCHTT